MAQRRAFWQIVADYSGVRRENDRTAKSLRQLDRERETFTKDSVSGNDAITASNKKADKSTQQRMGTLGRLSRAQRDQSAQAKASAAIDREVSRSTDDATAANERQSGSHKRSISVIGRLTAARRAHAASMREESSTSEEVTRAQDRATRASLAHQKASLSLEAATRRLADIQAKHGRESDKYANALLMMQRRENDLANASHRLEGETRKLENATRRAATSQRQASSSSGGLSRSLTGVAGGFFKAASSANIFGLALTGFKFAFIIAGVGDLIAALSQLSAAALSVIGPLASLGEASAALPGLFAAAVGGIASVIGAFSGIGAALKAGTAAQHAAGKEAKALGKAERNSGRQIRAAQRQVKQARQSAADTAHQNAESIQAGLRNVAQAELAVADAHKQVAQARQDAQRQLEDYSSSLKDLALQERGASQSVEEARRNLQKTLIDPSADNLAKDEAQLAYDEALKRLQDVKKEKQRTEQDAAVARKKGVKGSDQVQQALRNEKDATQNLADAEQSLKDTRHQNAEAAKAAAQSIRDALQGVKDATEKSSEATVSATATQTAFADAMKSLSPEQRTFVKQLLTMRKEMLRLRNAAARGLLPGLGDAMLMTLKLGPLAESAMYRFGKVLGHTAVNAAKLATSGPFQAMFARILDSSVKVLRHGGDALVNMGAALVYLMDGARPFTEWIAKTVLGWTALWRASAKAGDASGGIKTGLDKVKDTLIILGHSLRNVWTWYKEVQDAGGRKLGGNLLKGLEKITKGWAKWAATPKAHKELKEWFKNAGETVHAFSKLMGRVTRGFFNFGRKHSLAPIIDDIRKKLVPAVGRLFDKLGDAGVMDKMVTVLTQVVDLVTKIAGDNGGGMGAFVDTLGMVVENLNKLPVGVLNSLVTGLGIMAALKFTGLLSLLKAGGKGGFSAVTTGYSKTRGKQGQDRRRQKQKDEDLVSEGRSTGSKRLDKKAKKRVRKKGGSLPPSGSPEKPGKHRTPPPGKHRTPQPGEVPVPNAASEKSAYKAVGKAMADGLRKGWQVGVETVIPAINREIAAIIAAAKQRLGIKSPSRVFMQIGEMIAAGLARGMEASSGEVATAASVMTGSAVLAGEETAAAAGGSGKKPKGKKPKGGKPKGGKPKGGKPKGGKPTSSGGFFSRIFSRNRPRRAGGGGGGEKDPGKGASKTSRGAGKATSAVGALILALSFLPGPIGEAASQLSIFGMIAMSVAPLLKGLGPVLKQVGGWVASAAKMFGKYMGVILKVVGKAMGVLLKVVGKALFALGKLMLANPWLLLIAALVIVVVLIIKHWGTIKKIISKAINWVIDFIKKHWSIIKWFLGPLAVLITLVVKHWDTIKKVISKAVTGILTWVKKNWDGLKKIFSGVWDWVVGKAKGFWGLLSKAFGGGMDAVKNLFKNFKKDLKAIWTGIQGIMKGPVRFVVNTVLENGLLAGVRKIGKFIGSDKLQGVHAKLPPGFATGGIPSARDTSVYPGYTPGRDIGYIGVSGGEAIMRPEWTRAVGKDQINEWNRAARSGGVGGVRRKIQGNGFGGNFATGGIFRPTRSTRLAQGVHDQYTGFPAIDIATPIGSPVFAGTGGRVTRSRDLVGYEPRVAVQNGYRSYGKYIQINGPNGVNTLYAHLQSRGVQVGALVRGGEQIGVSGLTGHTYGPHLHFGSQRLSPLSFLNGVFSNGMAATGDAPLGVMNAAGLEAPKWLTKIVSNVGGWVKGKVNDGLDALTGKFGNNDFVKMLTDVPRQFIDGMIDKITNATDSRSSDANSNMGSKDVRAQVRAVAKRYGWDHGEEWNALSNVIASESGWDPNAASASSSARGLFQKMTSMHGPLEDTPAGQARWGLKYIKDRYGDPIGAWNFHRANGWYKDGGIVPDSAGDGVQKFARGGPVRGVGNRDTVPAMLTPGEFVMKKRAVKKIGVNNLHRLNGYGSSVGKGHRNPALGVQHFHEGGPVLGMKYKAHGNYVKALELLAGVKQDGYWDAHLSGLLKAGKYRHVIKKPVKKKTGTAGKGTVVNTGTFNVLSHTSDKQTIADLNKIFHAGKVGIMALQEVQGAKRSLLHNGYWKKHGWGVQAAAYGGGGYPDSAIVWKKALYERLKYGSKVLNKETVGGLPGGFRRVATYGLFRDKKTNAKFWEIAAHTINGANKYDQGHLSKANTPTRRRIRQEQYNTLGSLAKQLGKSAPVIVGGDLNNHKRPNVPGLTDLWSALHRNNQIDTMLSNPKDAKALSSKTVSSKGLASDHPAVLAAYKLLKGSKATTTLGGYLTDPSFSYLNKRMGLSNSDKFTGNTLKALQHVLDHTYGRKHDDLAYRPWKRWTPLESSIIQAQNAVAKTKKWESSLDKISSWGYTALLDDMFNKGMDDDGAYNTALEAATNQKLAKKLNDQLATLAGISGDDVQNMVKMVGALNAATGAPGLRDMARQLGMSDYDTVMLYEKALKAGRLGGVSAARRTKISGDVKSYRSGTFYFAGGGPVPGTGSGDTVPAMLTPGEFVMKKKAVDALGLQNLWAMNGIQRFASGGLVMAPEVTRAPHRSTVGVHAGRLASQTAQTITNNITYDVDIINPIAEKSTKSLTKALQRQSALKNAGGGTGWSSVPNQ